MTDKIVVRNLYKVFGETPERALKMAREGVPKDAIFEQTGHTLGVDNAAFEIHEGEIFVIMGLSGSGKSTVVRLLNRLIEPTAGEILVDGEDIARLDDAALLQLRRRKMSMVFQSFALMPHLSVVDNAAFGLELSGIERTERRRSAMEALERVGLEARAESYPDELSGGMQQRVGLARALANNPDVMLMDEAFSALDPLIRTEMQDELLNLQQKDRRTIVFISHDLDEAMRIGDRIAIMEGGRVVQVGSPEEILRNPADDYVRSFFRGVDVSTVLSAGDIARKTKTTVIEREGVGIRSALQRLKEHDQNFGYVVGREQKFHGIVSVDSLRSTLEQSGESSSLTSAFLDDVPAVANDTLLNDLIGVVAQAPCGIPIVNSDRRYLGVVTKARLLETLDREGDQAHG